MMTLRGPACARSAVLPRRLVVPGIAVWMAATASAHPLSFSSTVTYSPAQPSGGAASVANWTGAAFDADNIGGSGVNADGGSDNGAANDDFTYVANNRPVQGQSFLTGSAPNGYELHSVTARMAGYTNNTASGSNVTSWNLNEHTGPILLSIVEISGTTRTMISRQLFKAGSTGTPGSGTSVNGSGDHITFELPFTTHLKPNTTYGFEIAIGNGSSNHFEWLGTRTDPYADGTAYHYSGDTITPVAGDHVFQADMTALASPPPVFAHPGTLHTQADLDRMKAKVDASEEPWKSSFDILADSPWAQTWWPAYNIDYIVRGGSGNNYTRSQQDAQAIYELALRWHLTGDTAYADHAVHIANTWSDLIGIQGDTNASLAAGICGYLFASGGELLSTYSGWPEAEKQAYKDMMMRVFYPRNLDFLWRHHDTPFTKGGNTHYRLNWDTANMASVAAIGILCDNRAVYEQAVDHFKYGNGNGRVDRAAWYLFPDGTSQTEESGRDQAHNLGGWHAMALLCQMGWNQGDDLFGWDNNRALRAFEYNAKYNLFNDVPWVPHRNTTLTYTETLSGHGRGLGGYYQYELVHNHYANVKGIAAPWSKLAVDVTRPEPRPNTAFHPSQVDWLGLGSLTYARDPIATGAAPSGLVAHRSKDRVILNWWGTATATAYLVKRAASEAGPYTTLGTVTGSGLNFTDSTVADGVTYYYLVTATTPSGDLDSDPLEVRERLVARYPFDGNANETENGRHAEPKGPTMPAYASGFGGGQAISLNGSGPYVQLPVGSGNFEDITIATWVRWNGGANWQRVFDFGSDIDKYMMLTPKASNGAIRFQMTTSRATDGTLTLDGPAMPVGQWVHLAVTLQGDAATLYLNGSPSNSTTLPGARPLFAQPFCYLGRSMWNDDAYFSGMIDDFRIYNHALSGSEVHALWGQSANQPPVFQSRPLILSDAEEGTNYSSPAETLVTRATDPDGGGLIYSKVAGPAWLVVAANGALSGTPANADVGENIFVVRVTDSSGASDDVNLHVTVANLNGAPEWDSDPIDGGFVTQDESYSFSVAGNVSDADLGDSFTIGKHSGPAWLQVSADGTLSGSPGSGDVGLNEFTLRTTDLAGASSDVIFQVQVLPSALLRAHFRFEDNSDDASSGSHGVTTGSPAYAPGYAGQAIILDGVDDLVTLPAGAADYTDLTIATWVYWDGGGSWQRIFDFGNGTNQYLFLTPESGSGMRFAIKNGGSEQFVRTTRLPTQQWVHVAVTLAGDTATLFVNGFPMASNTKVTINPSDFAPTFNYIGDSQWASDPLFAGMIDDFRIFNYALETAEIASLAGVATSPYGTVAHWDFQEGTANAPVPGPATDGTYIGSISDVSGNGNHLSPWSGNTFLYRAAVPAATTPQTGAANTLSIQNNVSAPSSTTVGTPVNGWSPARWTIEATIRPNATSGNQTFVGRDSNNYAGTGPRSTLYLQTVGSALAVKFHDVAGNYWNITTASGTVVANQWQAVAATSDGSTLSLFRKNLTTGEANYTLLGSLDISSSVHPALAIGSGDGSDWNAGEFSVGRGLYNGAQTDRFLGFLDNIRLSDVALGPDEFLHSTPPALPEAPASVSATAFSAGKVILTWAPAAGATHYAVKRAETSGGPYVSIATSMTGTKYSDDGVSPGGTYHYMIVAENSGGTTDSAEATIMTPPEAPAGLMATPASLSAIDLTWTAAAGAGSYVVKRADVSGGPYTIVASDLNTTSYRDDGLDSGRVYHYLVSAVNAAGEADSQEASSATRGPVAYWTFEEGEPDTHVSYSPGSAGQYDGSVIDRSGNGNHLSAWAADWMWYRANTPDLTTPQTGLPNALSVQAANNYPAMSAIGTALTSWSPAEWTIEAAIRPDALSGNRTFVGRDSRNYAGTGNGSVLYFQTRGSSLAIQYTDVAGNIREVVSASGTITADQWHAVAAASDGNTLSLYHRNLSSGDATYTLLGTADLSSSSDPALAIGAGDGSDWDAGVISVGRGLWDGAHADRFFGFIDNVRLSDTALGPDQLLYSTPPLVSPGLVATTVSESRVDLTWAAVDGASRYTVGRSTQSGGPYTTISGDVTTTTFSDLGLDPTTTYYYVVRSGNAAGEGAESDEASATTAPAPITAAELAASRLMFDGSGTGSGQLHMTIGASVIGHVYQIEFSPDLTPGSWQPFGDPLTGTGGSLEKSDPLPEDPPRGFYRIRISP